MKPDLSGLSVVELQELASQASSMISARKNQDLLEAYAKLEEVARNAGSTLDELIAIGRNKPGRKSGSTGTRKPVEPRYRNPANPEQTWTGRGKKPRWLAAEIDNGKQLESFLIA
jgi:DNA-binding protein H-NS